MKSLYMHVQGDLYKALGKSISELANNYSSAEFKRFLKIHEFISTNWVLYRKGQSNFCTIGNLPVGNTAI